MSDLDLVPDLRTCGGTADVAPGPVHQLFAGKQVPLGESTNVRRLLPNLGRRLVGAWCFVDHYGPDDVASVPGMQVPPHPHIGLQTVSWLLEGSIQHTDSLGSSQLLTPGTLGLMTAGHAITHAEYSPDPHPPSLHGVQLWVALPAGARDVAPAWSFHRELPRITGPGGSATVLLGSMDGAASPGKVDTPLIGADVELRAGGNMLLALEPEFEHALLVMSGSAAAYGVPLLVGSMLYLGCARPDLRVTSERGARLLLLGGAPFDERIVMWWNFLARSNEEIVQARAEWMDGSRFADVPGFDGLRLPAPRLPPGRLKPGGAAR